LGTLIVRDLHLRKKETGAAEFVFLVAQGRPAAQSDGAPTIVSTRIRGGSWPSASSAWRACSAVIPMMSGIMNVLISATRRYSVTGILALVAGILILIGR